MFTFPLVHLQSVLLLHVQTVYFSSLFGLPKPHSQLYRMTVKGLNKEYIMGGRPERGSAGNLHSRSRNHKLEEVCIISHPHSKEGDSLKTKKAAVKLSVKDE